MATVNQYKFVGIDNSTSGAALTPFGSGNPLVSETYLIKSILLLPFVYLKRLKYLKIT